MKFDDLPSDVLYHIFKWAFRFHPSFQFCRAVGRLDSRIISDYPLMIVAYHMFLEYSCENEKSMLLFL